MYQVLCHSCKEPVSSEFDRPVLEEGAITFCRSCVGRDAIALIAVNTEKYQDFVMLDSMMANELSGQFGGVTNV